MHPIVILVLLAICISCQKEETNNIPLYMSIEEIILNNNSTHKITDAWVYIDDNLQGVYELPANFPILEDGVHKLRIKAGIKNNGIGGNRIPYPFYTSFIKEEQEFNPETTISIIPTVTYLETSTIDDNSEDFDGNGLNLVVDSMTFSIENTNPLNGKYGVITLTDSIWFSELTTKEITNLPQAGSPVYLELDYKCNTPFLIGVYVNFPQSVVLQKDLIWINPKEDWNKIYINLTSTISEAIGVDFFKIFIAIQRDNSLNTNTVCLDNLRIVY